MQAIDLTQISTTELEAALAARQAAAINKAQENEHQSWRTYEDEVHAKKDALRTKFVGQSPYHWGEQLAHAGVPVAAARVFAECVAAIFRRIEALEKKQQPASREAGPNCLPNVSTWIWKRSRSAYASSAALPSGVKMPLRMGENIRGGG